MGDLTTVRQITTLEWRARDEPDAPFYQGTVRVDTEPMDDQVDERITTAVLLRDQYGRIMHAYRVSTAQTSLARESARDIVAATVEDIQRDFGARHVPGRLEYRLKTVAQEMGYDDLCPCSTGSPENYDGPDRDCPLHGERPLTTQGV